MIVANMLCGVFMVAAQLAVATIPDYSVFMTMLRVFVILTIPAIGVQTILAQEAAAAVTEEARRNVAATARGVLGATFIIWVITALLTAIFRNQIAASFQFTGNTILWTTLLLILAAWWMPIFQGLLQGLQNFFPLGWSLILNGVGRFIAMLVVISIFHVHAAGATFGAFIGILSAAIMAAWPARVAFQPKGGTFDWESFLKKIAPLTAGAGSTLFLINVDMPVVQKYVPKEWTDYYSGAEAIGIALVTLCTPVAAVMFPKMVRGRATGKASNALFLAAVSTLALGGSAAIVCTIFPKLPLQILYFRRPDMVKAAVLIPWFMWAMLPVCVYNLLVNSLIARERYGVMPFAAGLPIAYAFTLQRFLEKNTLPPFETFTRVIQILMGFSLALMAISVFFSWRASCAESAENRSQPKAATP
jgi:O-antigen/teichoic acid export membrane protein